ncbi:MAG: cytochrome c3 family protein [Trueperaceae bacterium]|nr:cytochrome c3 family protein [Trueperaceae bacterium]
MKRAPRIIVTSIVVLAAAGLVAWQAPSFDAVLAQGAQQVESPHVLEVPFLEEWDASGHAAFLSESFRHWDDEGAVPENCAGCHTSEGYRDLVGADGSAVGSVESDATPSVITCVACHNDATVNLDAVTMPSGVEIGGLGNEAVCMGCHQGRDSGDDVAAAIEEAGVDDPDAVSEELGFMQPHYLVAAATQYGAEARGGVHYEDRSYDVAFEHVDGYATCTECHDSHSTRIDVSSCQGCHEDVNEPADVRRIRTLGSEVDYDGDGNVKEGIYHEVQGVKALLLDQIRRYAGEVAGTPVVYSGQAYPYFFTDQNENAQLDEDEASYPNRYQAWTPRLVRAVFNYQLVAKDPGAYAHNAKYVIQLMHDSIVDLGEALDGTQQEEQEETARAPGSGLLASAPSSTIFDGDRAALARLVQAQQDPFQGIQRDDAPHFRGSDDAFRHWDEDGAVPGSCSKCHSGEGLPFFLREGVTASQPLANGLQCKTCHTDLDTFSVYEPEEVAFPSGAVHAFEATDSNLCASCHQGRESGRSIVDATEGLDDDQISEQLSFINPHYFAAAATRFGSEAQGMYEYPDATYAGLYEHRQGPDRGPTQCTECHTPHTQEIQADGCNECHDAGTVGALDTIRERQADFDGDGDTGEGIAHEIRTMQETLYGALLDYARDTVGTPIVYDESSYPYFFVDTNGNGEVDAGEAAYPNRYQAMDAQTASRRLQLPVRPEGPGHLRPQPDLRPPGPLRHPARLRRGHERDGAAGLRELTARRGSARNGHGAAFGSLVSALRPTRPWPCPQPAVPSFVEHWDRA